MSSEALGILWIIIFVVAVVVGIILKYTYLGEYLKDEIISFFTPPPPPSKIDPHNYKPPKKILADSRAIFEREAPKPLPSPPINDQKSKPSTVSRYRCPLCGMNLTSYGLHDAISYICHLLREHEREIGDPRSIPCHSCRLYDWWSDDMPVSFSRTNPYCQHCGGTGIEPVMVEIVDGKEIVRQARVILNDDDLLICPECENIESRRLKCELCKKAGALTRREIRELGYTAPGRKH